MCQHQLIYYIKKQKLCQYQNLSQTIDQINLVETVYFPEGLYTCLRAYIDKWPLYQVSQKVPIIMSIDFALTNIFQNAFRKLFIDICVLCSQLIF